MTAGDAAGFGGRRIDDELLRIVPLHYRAAFSQVGGGMLRQIAIGRPLLTALLTSLSNQTALIRRFVFFGGEPHRLASTSNIPFAMLVLHKTEISFGGLDKLGVSGVVLVNHDRLNQSHVFNRHV